MQPTFALNFLERKKKPNYNLRRVKQNLCTTSVSNYIRKKENK